MPKTSSIDATSVVPGGTGWASRR